MSSIAMVVLDTVRKDAFNQSFDWLPGKWFTNCWSPSHWTVPVHASLFTGEYATDIGVYARSPELDCEGPVLAEKLASNEYETRAFSANPNISREFKFDRGFAEFNGTWHVRPFNRTDLYDWKGSAEMDRSQLENFLRGLVNCVQSDSSLLPSLYHAYEIKRGQKRLGKKYRDDGATQALRYLQDRDFGDQEFLFMNLMEAHSPYEPPSDYRSMEYDSFLGIEATINKSGLNTGVIRQAYDEAINYLSDIYKDIFSRLSEEFDYVITLSDHGELFGEHGAWRHGYGIYPELTDVPLVIYDGTDQKSECSETVSLKDVYDTVCDIAGFERESSRSLLSNVDSKEVLTTYHGITHQHKIETLRRKSYSDDVINRYDEPVHGIVSEDGQYAFEDIDGFHVPANWDEEEAGDRLRYHLDNRPQINNSNEELELSESSKAQLENLGYM